MLDLLEWLLDQLGLAYQRLDGSTPQKQRQDIVDRRVPQPGSRAAGQPAAHQTGGFDGLAAAAV